MPNYWVGMSGSTREQLVAKRDKIRELIGASSGVLVEDEIFYDRDEGVAYFLVRDLDGDHELGPVHEHFAPHHVKQLHTVDELDD